MLETEGAPSDVQYLVEERDGAGVGIQPVRAAALSEGDNAVSCPGPTSRP
jgi:hypothetical protein